jgi:hypothetical protein
MRKYKIIGEFDSYIDDDYLLVSSLENDCSSHKVYRISQGINFFLEKDIFCGAKVNLSKLDDEKLSYFVLVDEDGYEIELSMFLSDFL